MINIDLEIKGLDIITKNKDWSYNGHGLTQLEGLIKLNNYALVIIDNLDDVKPCQLLSLADPNAGDVLIKPLTKFAIKYDVGFVVLNHTPKNETTTYAGSYTLKKPLFTSLILTQNKQTGVYTLSEDKARIHKPKTITFRRGDNDTFYDFKDITEGTANTNPTATKTTVKLTIRRLSKR